MSFEFPDTADYPLFDAPINPTSDGPENPKYLYQVIVHRLEEMLSAPMPQAHKAILDTQFAMIARANDAYQKYKQIPESQHVTNGIQYTHGDTQPLRDYFSTHIAALRAQPQVPPEINKYDAATIVTDPASLARVAAYLSSTGILGDINVSVNAVAVHLSRPGDMHHHQTFRDLHTHDKNEYDLLNLHLDPKPGVLKAMIYLEDVSVLNGPFQATIGSNKWEYDETERIFAWGNSTGNYCQTRAHRDVMGAFPKRYRKNAILGKLIPNNSTQSAFFKKRLTTFVTEYPRCIDPDAPLTQEQFAKNVACIAEAQVKANTMFFDPSVVFHRGGIVEQGDRVNLQVIMRRTS